MQVQRRTRSQRFITACHQVNNNKRSNTAFCDTHCEHSPNTAVDATKPVASPESAAREHRTRPYNNNNLREKYEITAKHVQVMKI